MANNTGPAQTKGATPDPNTTTLLTELVSFATESAESNLELIDFIQAYLAGFGVRSQLFYNEERSKANLYAILGPQGRPGIALSGHTDVVPVTGQDWTSDPWSLVRRQDRLYGRGSCDMKGFIAVVLAAVPEMLHRPLQRPIHFCFSYDEEVGCKGVRSLLAYLRDQANKPVGCIVGEPSGMSVVTGHKGKLTMRCEVRGHACHSALLPHGVNAVESAAQVIDYLRKMAVERRENGPYDRDFDVPYTTIHTGVVRGGVAINIVPEYCCFDFEFRNLPIDPPKPLLSRVEEHAKTTILPGMRNEQGQRGGFTWSELASFPGLQTEPQAPLVQLALACSEEKTTRKVSFGTEAGLFHHIGVPSVVCGPGHIEQAHKPDEYVEFAQLARCERFVQRLVERLCADDF